MRVAALIPLVGCICNLLLAVFIFLRNPRAPQNRVYFFLGSLIAVWNLGQFFLFTTQSEASAQFWVRFLWFGVCFIPLLLFHISMLIAQIRVSRFVFLGYVLQGALAATVPTNFFITGVRHFGNSGWYAYGGPGLYLSTLSFALMFVAIVVLTRQRKALPPVYRSRLTALIVAQSALSVLGTNDVLPIIGVDYYPFTKLQVYPYGSIAAVFYGVIVGYSVLQHHLLDVQVGLGRVAAQVVRFAFLSITTLGLLLLVTLILPSAYTLTSLWTSVGVFMVSTGIATLVFPRLFGEEGMEKWERRILGDHFEYQDRIRAFTASMLRHGDLATLLDSLHEVLTGTFRFQRYWLILRDEGQRSFVISRAHPKESHPSLPELRFPSPVFDYFQPEAQNFLALGPASLRPVPDSLEAEARTQLSPLNAEFAFPLKWESDFLGFLLVGEKADEEPLTATDLHLLIELTKQLSVVVNQLRLKVEVLRTQEFDLLGRMSRGMAHDLNNLLTPISTLLQLATEGRLVQALDDGLLNIAARNVRTVRAYIKEALFFSENMRPDLQHARLDLIVRQAVDAARSACKISVQLIAQTPGEVLAEVDDVLIHRLLNNLISNAIDASAPGGEIRVELERLSKTEAARDWFRLRVIDHGVGIPKENLERVLRPYFTTKDRGDEGRGFGLGLAICRRIAALHGGQLTITSQLRRGTVVRVDLPSRSLRAELPAAAAATVAA